VTEREQRLQLIATAFPDRGTPPAGTIVVFDGFDQLDKESAVRAFAGKSRAQVAGLVGVGPTGIEGLWGIEELEVLEPEALHYYLEPFLRHLVTRTDEALDDFGFFLGYHLAEIAKRRSGIFTPAQRRTLVEIARYRAGLASGDNDWSVAYRGHYSSLIDHLQ